MAKKDKSLNLPKSSGSSDDLKSREIYRLKQEIAIEAALDRIRAKAMSMKHSDELNDIVTTLFEEFVGLNINLARCIIWIIDRKDHTTRMWLANSEADNTAESYLIPKLKNKYYQSVLDAWKKRRKRWSYELKGREKSAVDKALLQKTELSKLPKVVKRGIQSKKRVVINGSFYLFGMIEVSGPEELSQSQHRILSRFGNVFNQCYTRFLDLQKAEAQAREAQIEVALERVRARTMAIRQSHELRDVVSVMYNEMEILGLAKWGCVIMIFHNKTTQIEFWLAEETDSNLTGNYFAKGKDHPVYRKLWNHWKRQNPPFTLHHQDDYKREFDEYWLNETDFKSLPTQVKNSVLDRNEVFLNYASMRYGLLNAASYERLTPEMMKVLERFAKVFEQAYTRFLDLEKAEAQAREAQFEAALERIRSRSLAMRHTEEFSEVAVVLFNQLNDLGFNLQWCWFAIVNDKEKYTNIWYTEYKGTFNPKPSKQLFSDPEATGFVNAWKNKDAFYLSELCGEELDEYIKILGNNSEFKKGTSYKIFKKNKDGCLQQTHSFFKNGAIGYSSFHPRDPDTLPILSRFARTFEQTYTRFLDLQKAEAQAREAQIEAALERVRAASMAMHHSNQIPEVVQVLLEQFEALQVTKYIQAYIAIYNLEERTGEAYVSNLPGYSEVPFHFSYPLDSITTISENIKQWQEGAPFLYHHYEGSQVHKWGNALTATTGSDLIENYLVENDIQLLTMIEASFKYGSMGISSVSEFGENEKFILQRFAKVFEQTYTRFLDLQKAEAQAREAQIEAALERVRARAMAMHRSDELKEVIAHTFKQIQSLNFVIDFSSFNIQEDGSRDLNLWVASRNESYAQQIRVPHFDHPTFTMMDRYNETGEPLQYCKFSKSENRSFFNHAFTKSDFKDLVTPKRQKKLLNMDGQDILIAMSKNTGLQISNFQGHDYTDVEQKIILRFANVFDQAYTRFLDLQRAEAQAREAQIEAALERVRAASMAMHHSRDMNSVTKVLFMEFTKLDIEVARTTIVVFDEVKLLVSGWSFTSSGAIEKDAAPISGSKILKEFVKRWKNRKKVPNWVLELSGSPLKKYVNYIKENSQGGIKEEYAALGTTSTLILHVAFFGYGWIANRSDERLSNDTNNLIQRFAKVFEQAYTRFLDLQKAEAQAREAQIEAALERVRAASMAMHESEELQSVLSEIAGQLTLLDIRFNNINFSINESADTMEWWIVIPNAPVLPKIVVSKTNHKVFRLAKEAEKKKLNFYSYSLSKKEKNDFLKHVYKNTSLKTTPDRRKASYETEGMSVSVVRNKDVRLTMVRTDISSFSPEENDILKRFGKVFDQSYRRFLDLQKAETQAREAQIEAALERVRSASMAMHQSDDLLNVVKTVFEQLKFVGINPDACLLHEFTTEDNDDYFWVAAGGQEYVDKVHLPYIRHPYFSRLKKAKSQKLSTFQDTLTKKQKDDFFSHYFTIGSHKTVSKKRKAYIYSAPALNRSTALFKNTALTMMAYTNKPFTCEENDVFQRFAYVFEQSYTRFLDLQKAEEQAREAQIETALERVRAASMAMHSSSELSQVATTMFRQVQELNLTTEYTRIIISTIDENSGDTVFWMTQMGGDEITTHFEYNAFENEVYEADFRAFQKIDKHKRKEHTFSTVYEGEAFVEWLDWLLETNIITPEVIAIVNEAGINKWVENVVWYAYGALIISRESHLSEQGLNILKRFAAVFEQTYTRFLDLQKAEAQAREAQIEAALERVRARAMAMHVSQDIMKVAEELRSQMSLLGQPELESCIIQIYDEKNAQFEAWWVYEPLRGNQKTIVKGISVVPFDRTSWTREVFKKYKSSKTEYTIKSKGKMLKDWYHVLQEIAPETVEYDSKGKIEVPEILYYHFTKFSGGALIVISEDPPAEVTKSLQKRAASVFNLAFGRFLDLQKAETQAREAKIEAALERVRARTMAMHQSEDLAGVMHETIQQIKQLGIETDVCAINLLSDSKDWHVWVASPEQNYAREVHIPYFNHPMFKESHKAEKEKKSLITIPLNSRQLTKWYEHIFSHSDFGKLTNAKRKKVLLGAKSGMMSIALGNYSFLLVGKLNNNPYNDNELDTFKRFVQVFDQAYRRFLDLQIAEAQTREAQIDAALERVRAEISSMRSAADLEQITPFIWKELINLQIPFFRCGFFIMSERMQEVRVYLANSEGEAVTTLNIPYNSTENITNLVSNWRKQEIYIDQWTPEQFTSFFKSMMQQGHMTESTLDQDPPELLNLQFFPFQQGMFYIGSEISLEKAQQEVIQRMALTFQDAYTRYQDFQKVARARKNAEEALSELKSTQDQLVQAEKMASLGELTAGIAHEIKNPLNFVNNFSEVNAELADELIEALTPGSRSEDIEEVIELANDIKSNQEKIMHHGKRADSIVRNMLQHSRAGSGEKQATDINALADEYLRLAYHGLRAKDSNFNCKMETDFDDQIGMIEVIPQDFGRVLLNLITNAFQACAERSTLSLSKGTALSDQNNYKPLVKITTERVDSPSKDRGANGQIQITVSDNGSGIPDDIKDKIFQPFFTTKPTGEGTGLGLSMSYDIVTKGHGGTLEVESKEGEGTEFKIKLLIE